jgi:hypothetical protein
MGKRALRWPDGGDMASDDAVDQARGSVRRLGQESDARGFHWIALLDSNVADSLSGGETPVAGPTRVSGGIQDAPQHLALPPAARASWIDGHGVSPYEQKTQQSPCKGRSTALQLLHS